jgi:hypothetical protein
MPWQANLTLSVTKHSLKQPAAPGVWTFLAWKHSWRGPSQILTDQQTESTSRAARISDSGPGTRTTRSVCKLFRLGVAADLCSLAPVIESGGYVKVI